MASKSSKFQVYTVKKSRMFVYNTCNHQPCFHDAGGDALLAELFVVEESDDGVVLQDGEVVLANRLKDRLAAEVSDSVRFN